ncbi:hypothetical protein DB88DRAFT_477928 [Papiliotrema laurentii]|uniref:BZIP domain-containing protein n=1 Tax=Papiliotrema laurentii TaxID=5418 RepID=A0AAD9L8W7_PAPLA|nr:hypothetical protein DB88DRAFT_477928 [Papiliotrema laurentii]
MTTMNPQPPLPPPGPVDSKQGVLNSVPAWGSFLYQNFLLPAFSPSEWINGNTPGGNNSVDYFSSQPPSQPQTQASAQTTQPMLGQQTQPHSQPLVSTVPQSVAPSRSATYPLPPYSQPNPSFYNPYYVPPSAIPTSLLQSLPSSSDISPSLDIIDNLVASPSPVMPNIATPNDSPKRGTKRRAASLDSNDSGDDHHFDGEPDIAEGVERDGMIWGMKVEDYRALSARERKRVRNRISARTFRAKRKEHLSSLELDLEHKDTQIKAANSEAARLRKQVAELKARLSKYELV